MIFTISAAWDDEASVWTGHCDDIPAAADAPTLDELLAKISAMALDPLPDNHPEINPRLCSCRSRRSAKPSAPRLGSVRKYAHPNVRSYSNTALSSTWAPAAHSSKLVDSASLCEMPPAQGTKIMVVGATRAT